jgi:hypothetical protein
MTDRSLEPETPPRTDLDTEMPNDGYGIVPNATDEELRDTVRDAEAESGMTPPSDGE